MTSPQPPTRAELARFIDDPRTLRAFERLFTRVPDDIDSLTVRLSNVEDAGALTQGTASSAQGTASRVALALEQLTAAIMTQRSEAATIAALERRISELEALVLTGD